VVVMMMVVVGILDLGFGMAIGVTTITCSFYFCTGSGLESFASIMN